MEISSYIFHIRSDQHSCVASLATVAMVAALLMLVDLGLGFGRKLLRERSPSAGSSV